jgi:predicted nucleotidyltransferase component of viral defense system
LAKSKQKKVIAEKEEQVLEILSKEDFIDGFYLAGGTALALQIFHRKSLDLDFFTSKTFKPHQISDGLDSAFGYKVKVRGLERGTLHVKIKDSMVSFLEFKYPLLSKMQKKVYGVKLADIKDIAAMKLSAIHGRGSKKDFYDIYFILKKLYSFDNIVLFYKRKFSLSKEDITLLLKSLIYFENAEKEPEPILLEEANWEGVKNFLISETTKYSAKIFS